MYPGGKGNCYHQIINRMPPHDTYIELFLGAGSVMRNKRPAQLNIGIERDPRVLCDTAAEILPGAHVRIGDAAATPEVARSARITVYGDSRGAQYLFLCMDALDFLATYPFNGREFVYADPPYLRETRRSQRPLYEFELWEQDEHCQLLEALKALPCDVAISGYASELYDELLSDWTTHTFEAVTRSGETATEWLWMNYPEPIALHDYSLLGDDFRERERIKRKKQRWVNRLLRMDRQERQAIMAAIHEAGIVVDHRQKRRAAPVDNHRNGDAGQHRQK